MHRGVDPLRRPGLRVDGEVLARPVRLDHPALALLAPDVGAVQVQVASLAEPPELPVPEDVAADAHYRRPRVGVASSTAMSAASRQDGQAVTAG